MSHAGGASHKALGLMVLACCLAGGCACPCGWDAGPFSPPDASGGQPFLSDGPAPAGEEGRRPPTVGALARRVGRRVASGTKNRVLAPLKERAAIVAARLDAATDGMRVEGYPDHEIKGPAEAELLALRRPSQFLPVPTYDVFGHAPQLPRLPAVGSAANPDEGAPATPVEKPAPENSPAPAPPPTSDQTDAGEKPENAPPQPVELPPPPSNEASGRDRSALPQWAPPVLRTSVSSETERNVVRFRRPTVDSRR